MSSFSVRPVLSRNHSDQSDGVCVLPVFFLPDTFKTLDEDGDGVISLGFSEVTTSRQKNEYY